MKLNKISLEFTAEEIEAIHYAINLGIRSYKGSISKCADDWIETAEEIRKMLPTKLRLTNWKRDDKQ